MTAMTVNVDITLINESGKHLTSHDDLIVFFQTYYPEFVCAWRVIGDPGGPTMTLVIREKYHRQALENK